MECLNNCTDRAIIQDYYGVKLMNCHELQSMTFNHPYNIRVGNCEGVIEGKHPCDFHHRSCNSSLVILWLSLSIMLFILSYLILIWLRYKLIKKSIHKNSYKVKFSKNKVIFENDESIVKRSVISICIYLCLGIHLGDACIGFKESANFYKGKATNIICTNNGNYTIPLGKFIINNEMVYETSDWDIENHLEWACAGGSCLSVEDCDKHNYKISSYEDVWEKGICHSMIGGCAFGRGCIQGSLKLKLFNKFKVYKLSKIESKSTYIEDFKDCQIQLHQNIDQTIGNHYIVSSPTSSWLCEDYSMPFKSEFLELGDIQILNNKTLIFDWDSLNCGKNWYNLDCRTPKSFISLISKRCSSIPGWTPIGFVKNDLMSNFYIVNTGPFDIEFKCVSTKVIVPQSNCTITTEELWGVRSHSSGIYLTVRAFSKTIMTSTRYLNPCTKEYDMIDCNNKLNFIKIPETLYDSCILSNITDKTMDNNQYYSIDNYKISASTNFDIFTGSSLSFLGTMLSLGSTSIIWIIILLFLCKR